MTSMPFALELGAQVEGKQNAHTLHQVPETIRRKGQSRVKEVRQYACSSRETLWKCFVVTKEDPGHEYRGLDAY